MGDSFNDLDAPVLDRPTQTEGCCSPEDLSLDDLPNQDDTDHHLLGGVIPVWPREEGAVEEDDDERRGPP